MNLQELMESHRAYSFPKYFSFYARNNPPTNQIHVTSTSYFYCQEAFSAHQHLILNVGENALKDR